MTAKNKKTVVRKTTFEKEELLKEKEDLLKDKAFLKLTPSARLKIHEQLRKRIWGKQYNKLSLKGLRVTKTPIA